MGKGSKSRSKEESKPPASGGLPFVKDTSALDPVLSSLFDKSDGPVKAPTVQYVNVPAKSSKAAADAEDEDEDQDLDVDSRESEDELMEDASKDSDSESAEEPAPETQGRKRKRGAAGEDLEETYMRRIAKEEEKADQKRNEEYAKRQKPTEDSEESDASDDESEIERSDDDEAVPVPVHESLTGGDKVDDVEKSNRTVFLGNVSTQAIRSKAAKKTLLRHLGSFCSTLSESTGPHKVESIRFRSVPFSSGGGIPKRASFARQEILDETTPSTNAYVVYSTVQAARQAPAALNGSVVLDRHLRVDSVAHPAAIDHKRCVFVGNLDFVDLETPVEDENGKKKKPRAPADIEEGLWRIFNEHTGTSKDKKAPKKNVEFVRVIRDRNTRVGKGFAYVQFYDGISVEQALPLNGKNFPPRLPRKLRVTRARKVAKKSENDGKDSKMAEAQKTLQDELVKANSKATISGNSFVFEGHRATENGPSQIKVKTKSRGSKGSKEKRNNRSNRRAAAYKAAGGKRP
ncbi:hypothetical protein N7470_009159 [Penicillium chermesinum]|nr:hypothetical protein N7470_009159 [Penicillium chermesinum]